ncbi:WD40 repeat domain-containing serine/threonine protein kinase [Frigoriglobus tundricola]|uniref:Protein kinase domain-containing protein n=1 Tax=Frigoriglobus tundricola TaxID=2774151 RepID=A0A6M5YYT8_9BACT|nr:serine/threonine-protein kinase [Frigoriglobus tundricola]QJW99125.1 hypothetical protein FTUN_6725 [Frigoriglobus tundricola]
MPDRAANRPIPPLPVFLCKVAAVRRTSWARLLRDDQVRRWQNHQRVFVEAYLQHLPALAEVPDALIDLIYGEVLLREQAGDTPHPDEYLNRFPAHAATLNRQFAVHAVFAPAGAPLLRVPTAPLIDAVPQVPGYEVLDELGRGGCGVVYRARQKGLGRVVALKMIDGPIVAHAVERFRLEAEAIGRLQHPHIVQIYEVGEHEGRPFFSLEFVNGGTLSDRLDGAPLPTAVAAELVETLARAVAVAHQSGVIHRDLKPGNVLLQRPDAQTAESDGADLGTLRPKISDFGLAKLFAEDDARGATGSPTRPNELLGTPAYMSPEQAQCRNHEIRPASDVYALGAILYELLTGRPPFVGVSLVEVLAQVAFEDPVPPGRLRPGLPRDLEMVCLKCLQKAPPRRYASAQELADDLRRFSDGKPVRARPVSAAERVLKWTRRRPAAAATIVAAVLSAATGFCVITVLWQNARLALAGEREARQRADSEQQRAVQSEAEARQANTGAESARREAERARAAAEDDRNRAASALRAAEDNLYFGQFALADRAWHTGHLSQAEERLRLCPPAQRAWEWNYLMRLSRPHTATFGAPGSKPPSALAASPDGQLFASIGGGGKGPLSLWDVRTGHVLAALDAQDCVAFSPDGKVLAAGGAENTIRVWDLEDSKPKGPRTLRGHNAPVTGLAFASNSVRLASAGGDGEVRVWDPRSNGKSLLTVIHNPQMKKRTVAAFTPDNGHLITGGDDHHVRVWDLGPKPQRTFTLDHTSGVRCLAVSRHAKHWELLAGATDGRLRLWHLPNNMASHDERPRVDVRGHADTVQAVAFDGTGTRFGSVGRDGLVKVWTDTGRERATLRGLNGVAFLRDGKQLLAPQPDGTVASWDSSFRRSHAVVRDLPRPLTQLAFAHDGQRLAALTDDRKVALWESGSMTPVPLPAATGDVHAIGFGADRQCLAVRTGSDGQWLLGSVTRPEASVRLATGAGTPVAGAFSSDGRRLALVGPDRTAGVWDTASGRRLLSAALADETGARMSLSSDGRRLAVLSGRQLVVRDVETGEILCTREKPAGPGTVAISPDGLRVAIATRDGVVRVWDVDRADEGHTLAGRDGSTLGLAFTPDGRRLATAGKEGTVRIWDHRTEQELMGLDQPAEVLAMAFAPDGRFAVSGKDKSLQIWDGRPLP